MNIFGCLCGFRYLIEVEPSLGSIQPTEHWMNEVIIRQFDWQADVGRQANTPSSNNWYWTFKNLPAIFRHSLWFSSAIFNCSTSAGAASAFFSVLASVFVDSFFGSLDGEIQASFKNSLTFPASFSAYASFHSLRGSIHAIFENFIISFLAPLLIQQLGLKQHQQQPCSFFSPFNNWEHRLVSRWFARSIHE